MEPKDFDMNPIIKWDKVYVPNPIVCTDKTYPTYEEMDADIGESLEITRNLAFANNIPFIKYKTYHTPKPEYAEELKSTYVPFSKEDLVW